MCILFSLGSRSEPDFFSDIKSQEIGDIDTQPDPSYDVRYTGLEGETKI